MARCRVRMCCRLVLAVAALPLSLDASGQEVNENDIVLEELPEAVVATMEARDQWLAALPRGEGDVFEFIAVDMQRWVPGSTVRVAFRGGNSALHQKIADATKNITDNCNLILDFGHDSQTGNYRTWSTTDTAHVAEIRVSFDQGGFFSLIGRDSVNENIGSPAGPVGGRANQRSLNLGGYDVAMPADWKRTVRHEFLHALGFKHVHQNPLGACDSQFRWENEPGYIPTQDAQGRFITDGNGKRPGIYTYLSGFPNFWGRAKVDHNLRQIAPDPGVTLGSFDQASIMLYRFPALFYVSIPNSCQPSGGTEDLSSGDIAGLQHLYPHEEAAIADVAARNVSLYELVRDTKLVEPNVKSGVLQSLRVDQTPAVGAPE